MDLMNYVKPELVAVAIVLYFIGIWMKQSEVVKDKFIPAINGVISIVICGIYIVATCSVGSGSDLAMAIFTSITQGVLVAGLSTYVDQLIKQGAKKE